MPVTNCPACGHDLHAFPDVERCPQCGEQVQATRDSSAAIRDCYQRTSELAVRGEIDAALDEVRSGLNNYDAPDLHLLAAILCQRTGRTAEVSAHVAAIPVDDALRTEAEWLLRSQKRQASVAAGEGGDADAADVFSLDEIIGRPPQAPPTPVKGPRTWPLALVGLALLSLLIFWFAGGERWSQFGLSLAADKGGVEPAAASESGAEDEVNIERTSGPVLLPTPTPSALPPATPTVPSDLVSEPNASRELAGLGEDRSFSSDAIFELDIYLRNDGHDELAALDVNAFLQDGELTLTGYVPLAVQRTQLIDITEQVPGVSAVSARELYVRPPSTYVVQEGDTLWSITFEIYGDVERMEDVYSANRDQMTSPSALAVGMELALPPFE